MTELAKLGIVVIGRNEAPRLRYCLQSLPANLPVCYVDSASDDDSPAIARSMSVPLLQLSNATPLGAGRARNAGFEALLARHEQLEMVFFIDGDCVLDPDFLGVATALLGRRTDCAIVVGRLEESNMHKNVYAILANLEWSNPETGEMRDFGQLGGIMLVRVADFTNVGGFNPDFIAGEDSELGIRLYLNGRKTMRIANRMAQHAMEMQHFGQWWQRSVRAGHALAHRYAVHGKSVLGDSRSAVRSTFVYAIAIPVVTLFAVPVVGLWAILPVFGYGYLGFRSFSYFRRRGATRSHSLTGAIYGILAKFANGIGVIRFHLQRTRGSFKIIEYK
jgi:glycosyltransferase involved in cell wall biosynthesis